MLWAHTKCQGLFHIITSWVLFYHKLLTWYTFERYTNQKEKGLSNVSYNEKNKAANAFG